MEANVPVPERLIESKEHYSYLAQLLINAHNDGQLPEVEKVSVEPDYGYFATLQYKTGERRVIFGHDLGVNPSASKELVADKGYTKFVLRENNIKCPEGTELLLPWWADTLRASDSKKFDDIIKDTSGANEYIEESFGYPVYVKPSRGSQGVGVTKVHSQEELDETFYSFGTERVKVALIEEELRMPDYRLMIFDGELVSAYQRQPLSVIGDGAKTIEELIDAKHGDLTELKRDIHMERQRPLIEKKLAKAGMLLTDIVAPGESLQLLDISNLSAGGTPKDVINVIHPRWEELAREISKVFNLRVCGVDLACADITNPDSDYSVIEVNASPGTRQFLASGEDNEDRLKELFIRFFQNP